MRNPPPPWFPEESGLGLLAAQQALFHLGSLPPGLPDLQGVVVFVLVLQGLAVPCGPEQLAPPVHLILVFILRKRGSWPSSAQAPAPLPPKLPGIAPGSPGLSPHHLGFAGLEAELFNEVI